MLLKLEFTKYNLSVAQASVSAVEDNKNFEIVSWQLDVSQDSHELDEKVIRCVHHKG